LIEAVACVLQMRGGYAHANANLVRPITEDIRFVSRQRVPATIHYALNNSFGFVGINTALVLRSAGPPGAWPHTRRDCPHGRLPIPVPGRTGARHGGGSLRRVRRTDQDGRRDPGLLRPRPVCARPRWTTEPDPLHPTGDLRGQRAELLPAVEGGRRSRQSGLRSQPGRVQRYVGRGGFLLRRWAEAGQEAWGAHGRRRERGNGRGAGKNGEGGTRPRS